jgi:LysM repeat protein
MFKKSHVILIALIVLLGLTACERSATSATVDEATATLPFPTPGEDSATQDPIGTLLAWGYATQTQMAVEAEGLVDEGDEATPTPGDGLTATVDPDATATTPAPEEPTESLEATPTVVVESPNSYTIREGEHPYCIARRFDVHPDDLLDANGLARDTLVFPGEKLDIPQNARPFDGERALLLHPTTYSVVAGDTLYTIACKFGDVDPNVIAEINGIDVDATLTIGQILDIP